MKELTRAEMLTMFGMLQIVNAENEVILNKAIEWDFKHKTKRVGVETEYFSEEELLQQQINDLETKKRELEKELANSLLTPKSI